jgi:hypothetical protein
MIWRVVMTMDKTRVSRFIAVRCDWPLLARAAHPLAIPSHSNALEMSLYRPHAIAVSQGAIAASQGGITMNTKLRTRMLVFALVDERGVESCKVLLRKKAGGCDCCGLQSEDRRRL